MWELVLLINCVYNYTHQVALVDISEETLVKICEDLRKEYGPERVLDLKCDVTDKEGLVRDFMIVNYLLLCIWDLYLYVHVHVCSLGANMCINFVS